MRIQGIQDLRSRLRDVIYAVNRRVVDSVSQLRGMMDSMKSGDSVVLLVEREGHLVYVPLELE